MDFTDNLNNHVYIIIRSAGERTECLCKELVLLQGFLEENITIIRKTPFTLALQASFEAGIASKLPWTLCLDADVLLLPDTIHEMVCFAEQQDPLIFEIQALVLDKFIGGPRQAGNHLYRTTLLPQALKFIPQEQSNIRPETHTITTMKNHGFPWRRMDYLAGIHDFEQYHRDIFRKCFVQAHKHQEFAEIFLSYWPQQAVKDYDYKMAMRGFIEGLEFEGVVQIDVHQEIYRERFHKLHIVEKANIQPGDFSQADIELLVKNWIKPPVYDKYFQYEMISHANERPKHTIRKMNLVKKWKTLGLFKFLLFVFGRGLEKAGSTIARLVDKQDELIITKMSEPQPGKFDQ